MAKFNSKRKISEEITYVTKQVDTTVALLDTLENDVVLDALQYLSEYVGVHVNNLKYVQQCRITQKLLNLLDRNITILRLSLRLLESLLTIKETVTELDQDIYNDKIQIISQMYISHKDVSVRQFCVSIILKLTQSCRISCLIFKTETLKSILDTIKPTTDRNFLRCNLELLLKLLNAPVASSFLPKMQEFNISVLLNQLGSHEKTIVQLTYEIINKITSYRFDVFQKMFKKARLVETMLEVVMDPAYQEYHETAFDIIINCMKNKETLDYFIKSLEFLQFCEWVKTCDHKYLFSCILILEQLTRIPSNRQMLFDLSVENSLLSFLRSKENKVLNKTCEAISNMMAHKYCCEEMLKPHVLKELFLILAKKDQEVCGNEVVLKTILDFSRRNLNTLDMIHSLGAHKILLGYIKKGIGFISEESFLGILEILYKISMNPSLRHDIVSANFFEKLLDLYQTAPASIATVACEIMTNLMICSEFRRIFLLLNGPRIFLRTLQSSKDTKLLKNVLFFIHSNLIYEKVVMNFLYNNIVGILKQFPVTFKLQMPISEKILKLIYNSHLSLKFFDTNKLDFTDKLENKFYLIDGQWTDGFPFPDNLEKLPLSTAYTIYIVDYTLEIKYEDDSSASSTISPRKVSSERTVSILSKMSSSISSYNRRNLFKINYGKVSSDPYLPRYIYNANKYLFQAKGTEEKVKILAKYIDAIFRRPINGYSKLEKIHNFKLHLEMLKHELGSNTIPVGLLRQGRHCERALLFKALADKCYIPTSLVKGKSSLYWNEIILFNTESKDNTLKLYVVDLMNNIGDLFPVGSRCANHYCNLHG